MFPLPHALEVLLDVLDDVELLLDHLPLLDVELLELEVLELDDEVLLLELLKLHQTTTFS